MGKLVKTLDFLTGGALMDSIKDDKSKDTPLPKPPKISDADIQEDAEKKRRRLAARKGIEDTILTGPTGTEPGTVNRRTLLGIRGDG